MISVNFLRMLSPSVVVLFVYEECTLYLVLVAELD
jgi:hypothetical protein